jgi:xylulokinase
MSEESLLGIDIGTSATKGVLTRPDGSVIAETVRPHRLSIPRPGWAEHDVEATWWCDLLAVCAELAPVAGTGLRGICISGIGPCVVPCDAQLRPLRPAILYGIDTRATEEVAELTRRFGEQAILERGGSALSSQALGPKLLWLQRHEPEVWHRTTGWYMASSFAVARLTGSYVLDHHSASQCDPLYDLRAGSWNEDWASEVAPGVPLPRLVWPSDVVGVVTDDAARETGLPAGTPVVAGTIDAWAEAFSVGVRRPGDLMLMYGSTMFLVQVVPTGAVPDALLWSTQGNEPGMQSLAAGMSTSGVLTEWVRDLSGRPDWASFVAEADAVPPGSRGLLLLPYFSGERTPVYDPLARGVIAGLTLQHGRGELLRASYEATAFGTRQILELLAASAGPPTRIVAVGGGTNAELWLQILSDVTGSPQQLPAETLGAAYGDALLAGIGTGVLAPDTDWTRPGREITPSESSRDLYDDLFELYGQLYTQTADVVHRLALLAGADPGLTSDGGSRSAP